MSNYKQECPDRYQSSHGLLSDTGQNMSCPTPESISHAGKYNPIYKAMYRMGLFDNRFVRPNPCSHYEDMWYHYLCNDDIRDRYIQKFRRIYEAGIIPITKPVIKLSALKFSGNCHISVTGPCNLSYSYDGIRWYTLTELDLNGTVYVRGTLGKATESVYSRISADGLTITGDFGDIKPTNTYYKLFEGSKVRFDECALTYNAPYAYHSFLMNAAVSGAPYLPETLYEHCFEDMYYSANVSQAPILPETPLAPYCYYGMFEYSTLSTPPEIPNNTLVRACYQRMFRGCTNLITTPELYASALAIDAYNGMYYGCSNVNEAYIYCDDEYINTDYTRDLLNSVAPVGTLYCAGNRDRNLWKTSTAIPDGWFIKNINAWITVHGDNCTFLVDGIPLSPEESIPVYTNVPHTIECITDDLHKFVRWDDDLPLNPREVTLDTDTEFTAVIQSIITVTLEGTDCYFRFDHVTYTEPVVTINGIHLIECIPPDNYRFVSWSDGSADNPYSVDIPDTTTFVATTIRQYNLYLTGVDCIFTVDGDPYNPAKMYDTGEHVIQVFTDKDFITWADTLTHENPRTINLIEDSAYAVTSDDLVYIQILPHNCTITIDGNPFVSGYYYPGVHELVATPNTGYEFTTWSDDVTTASRTINATTSVSLIAQADLYYDLIAPIIPHGSYKFNDTIYESLNLHIKSGDYIVEFIEEPHYEFVKWDVNTFESTSNPLSFYLGEDITITPTTRYYDTLTLNGINTTFKVGSETVTSVRVYTGSTTVTAVPNPSGVWRGWEDGVMDLTRTFTVTEDTEITATTDVTVTITLIGEHCNLLVDGVAYTEPVTVNAHTPHNISCVVDSGYIFYQWSGDYTSKNNPAQPIVHDSVTITAEVYDEVLVTIDNDFQFTVGSSTYQAPYTFRVACGVDYTITPIIVDDAPNYWWQFDSWSDGCLTKTNTRSFTEDTLLHANCVKLIQISFVEDPLCTFYYDNILYTEPIKIPAGTHVIKCVTDELHTFVKWVDESIIRVLTGSTREVVMPASFEFEAEIHEPMTVDLTVPHGSSTIGGVVATHREVAYYRNCVIAWVRTDNYTFKEWQVYFGDHYSIEPNASMEWCMAENIVATAVCYDPLHYNFLSAFCLIYVNGVMSNKGEFGRGDTLIVKGVDTMNYRFVSWSDGVTDNPRTFSNQLTDIDIHAIMIKVLTITLSGEHCKFYIDSENISTKQVDQGSAVVIECVPDDMYIFTSWSDGNTDNPRTLTNIQDNKTLSVVLESPHLLKIAGADGYCYIDGVQTESLLCVHGTTHQIAVELPFEKMFVKWSDGNANNPREVIVNSDVTYTVKSNDALILTAVDDFLLGLDAGYSGPNIYYELPGEPRQTLTTTPISIPSGGITRLSGEPKSVSSIVDQPVLYTSGRFTVKGDLVCMSMGTMQHPSRGCYSNLFNRTSVIDASGLTMSDYANSYTYAYMFYNCSQLAGSVQGISCTDYCVDDGNYYRMFTNCTLLENAFRYGIGHSGREWEVMPYSFYETFSGCSSLKSVHSFRYVECVGWYGFYGTYKNCTSLESSENFAFANNLTHGIREYGCAYTFEGCTSLVSSFTGFKPKAPTGSWGGDYMCYRMFADCTSLVGVPTEFNTGTNLPGPGCYKEMYKGCTSLERTPAVKCYILTDDACTSMFEGCTGLKKAVCTSIPNSSGCMNMFKDCNPSATFEHSGYERDWVDVNTPIEWFDMITCRGNHCKFIINGIERSSILAVRSSTYTIECIPDEGYEFVAWSSYSMDNPMSYTTPYSSSLAKEFDAYVKSTTATLSCTGSGDLYLTKTVGKVQYSLDGVVWTDLAEREGITLSDTPIYIRQAAYYVASTENYVQFNVNGYTAELYIDGDIEAMGPMRPYAYYNMFNNCRALYIPPKLSAKLLFEGCYMYMFMYCSHLTEAFIAGGPCNYYICSNMFYNVNTTGVLHLPVDSDWSEKPANWTIERDYNP